MYAARLARALYERLDAKIFGMGGPLMREAGVEIITDQSEVAVVGITEILKPLPSLREAMNRLVEEAERRRPANSTTFASVSRRPFSCAPRAARPHSAR